MKRFAGLMALTMLLCASNQVASQSTKSVDKLKKNLRGVQSKKSQILGAIRKAKREAKVVMGDIERVDSQLSEVEGALDSTREKLILGRHEQQELKSDLEEATENLSFKTEQLRRRLRAMAMQKLESPISVLLTSRDLGELASRKMVLERIALRDRELLEEVRSLQKRVHARKLRQDELVTEISNLKSRQEQFQATLQTKRNEKKSYLDELQSQQAELRKQYDQLESESRDLAARIRAYQLSRPKGTPSLPAFRGGLSMPVSGRVSSGFGYRTHPILKERRLHTGIDFAAAAGTPIRAAADGVVITSTYLRGYGNAIVIDHGGSVATLYAHCSVLLIQSGASVKRGQVIAKVGSTGLSTGPHLHFEVRINGTPVDPRGRL